MLYASFQKIRHQIFFVINQVRLRNTDIIQENVKIGEDKKGLIEEIATENVKCVYIRKVILFLKMVFVVIDHVTDILLIVTLFQINQVWFAAIYLTVDVFPAAIIMWSKYQKEQSWKVLVNLTF